MMTSTMVAHPQITDDEELKPQRFNIASALAAPFTGLSEAVESNLHRACRNGDCDKIKNIFDDKICLRGKYFITANDEIRNPPIKNYINERNRLGATPLWLAAVAGHTGAAEILITYGASLDIEDIKGQTPLHAAAKFDHCECVRLLLEAGANPNGSDMHISTPIHAAALDNYPRTMALLIKYGADVNGRHARMQSNNCRSDYAGNLPVYMTLVYHHFECFEQLVRGGADLCLPPAILNSESSLPLVQGILRYGCDLKYLKLLVISGGIKSFREIDDLLRLYNNKRTSKAKEECVNYLTTTKKQPFPLSSVSRIIIRKQMGQRRLQEIDQLTLPSKLKQFLSLNLLEI